MTFLVHDSGINKVHTSFIRTVWNSDSRLSPQGNRFSLALTGEMDLLQKGDPGPLAGTLTLKEYDCSFAPNRGFQTSRDFHDVLALSQSVLVSINTH